MTSSGQTAGPTRCFRASVTTSTRTHAYCIFSNGWRANRHCRISPTVPDVFERGQGGSMAAKINVQTNVVEGQPGYRSTLITINNNDPKRLDFLKAGEQFFRACGRPEDAEEVEQASRQK